mmetsp:Transcript_12701/g.25891  ORF Transcript_12701/g.25891 Transcript_12701/m.25891 type:complete len:250 (-) Transcript_12701:29-778(-)
MSDSDYEPEYLPEDVTLPGGLTISVMTLVPPPLEYMSALHDNELEVSSRVVWTGSLLLCEFLCADPLRVRGSCLELGAGTGIVSIMLAKKGMGDSIVMTDGDDEALSLLRENLKMNGLDMAVPPSYMWGDDDDQIDSLRSFLKLPSPLQFDTILAGDVMYKSELPNLFFSSVRRLLSPAGVLYLCHIPRNGVTHEMVVKTCEGLGLSIVQDDSFSFDSPTSPTPLPPQAKMEDAVRAVVYKVTLNKEAI